MKRILFILIAFMSVSTVIYASFPVTKESSDRIDSNNQPLEAPPYDKETMVVLCAIGLIGIAGLHRFVVGDTLGGVLMLLTMGFCGIWTIIDLIRIAGGNWTPPSS